MSHEMHFFFRSLEDIRTVTYILKHFLNFIRSHVLRCVGVKSVTFFTTLLCKKKKEEATGLHFCAECEDFEKQKY